MGLLLASKIIGRASRSLLDSTGVQWPLDELREHLSDAQRATVLHLPEANPIGTVMRVVIGPRQPLPADSYTLIKVPRNMTVAQGENWSEQDPYDNTVSGESIRLVDEESRNVKRGWTVAPEIPQAIRNYSYDTRDRRAFYISPGGHIGAGDRVLIEVVYSASPPDVMTQAQAAANAEDDTITLDDIYQPALLSYTLHRAHAKDSATVNADPARASLYFQQFLTTLLGRQDVELRLHPGQQERVRQS